NHTVRVTIPPGVTAGQLIRLAGQGEPASGRGSAGDLYLETHIRPHRLFQLDGRDVTLTLPVAPWEAALGASVTVPTLGGAVAVRKASEALDDRAVSLGVVEHLGEGFLQFLRRLAQQPPAGGHRFLLHLETLGVLQRHVEEDPLHRIERGICPRLHARERERERLLVEIKGACAAPEHVARKLVEDDDQTQAPPRTVGPALELSGCGTLEELAEAHADLLVAPGGEP